MILYLTHMTLLQSTTHRGATEMAAPSGRVYSAYDRAYQARPEQVRKRVMRNAARRMMIAKHGREALRGRDVDHKRGTGAGNGMGNLQVISQSANRSKK